MTMAGWAVVVWLVVLCVHDLRDHALPNRLTVPAAAAAIAMGCTDIPAALSMAVLCAPYLVAAIAGACGGGDVKLAVTLGALVADPALALLVVLAAAVATLVVAVCTRDAARGAGIAHGPALAAAAITVGGVWV